ncbi:MAG: fasciclin domain-containing protein [Bacteroidaceae bacterium]|nr:fasciclin domain-containing protein [Bacteroidaceae bacterium]
MKLLRNIFIGVACLGGFMACEDSVEGEHYYTFTGEMMSDYITTRSEYSDFARIVERADLMDLLSTYGHYTCFLPSNTAFASYLQQNGLSSVEELSDGMCDTIARTHLVGNMFTTLEMMDGALNTANMNRQYLQISHEKDSFDNTVTVLNKVAQIYYATQNDSVENGIVHPISAVLESYSAVLPDVMAANPRLSLFNEALKETGLAEVVRQVVDESYVRNENLYRYRSHTWTEVAVTPDERRIGFTIVAETDDVFKEKTQSTPWPVDPADKQNRLKQLYDYAANTIVKKAGEENEEYWKFENLTDPKNPLYRFMAYHIVTRDAKGENLLTGRPFQYSQFDSYSMGIYQDRVNPTDWYETLLPHTMLKFERLTAQGEEFRNSYRSTDARHYVNRRDDAVYDIRGAEVNPTVENEYENVALNGMYFYVDDIVNFTSEVQDKVQNMRIRMDFSTVFPEIMTNGIRQNGSPEVDDNNDVADETFKNGKNYYFPDGYLANVTMRGSFQFVYRRPHINFWSWAGDEFNLFGDYDFEFRLPPVPYTGEWQVRLGFCALDTRGMAQIYFDGVAQGIPLDMRKYLNHDAIMGSNFIDNLEDYEALTEEEKAEDQKALRALGYYRGPRGGYHSSGSWPPGEWVILPQTHRVVLYQGTITADEDHFLRIRSASKSKLGNNNEFMIDYMELVPKSVWGSNGAGQMEDDL